MVFQENSDQQVTIHRVKEKGHDTVTSVKVTCSHSFIDLGVGNIIFLLAGDLLGIRSIRQLFEYKVVRVNDETVKRNKERSFVTKVDDNNGDFEANGLAKIMVAEIVVEEN